MTAQPEFMAVGQGVVVTIVPSDFLEYKQSISMAINGVRQVMTRRTMVNVTSSGGSTSIYVVLQVNMK